MFRGHAALRGLHPARLVPIAGLRVPGLSTRGGGPASVDPLTRQPNPPPSPPRDPPRSYPPPMPSRNPRPCTSWPCSHLRPCPIHDKTNPELERQRNTKRTTSLTIYRSPRWRTLRTRILRARPRCQAPACRQPSEDVDHETPIEDGGEPWAEENLVALCHSCHSRKTARDVARRRASSTSSARRREGKGGRDREDPPPEDRRGGRTRIAEGPVDLVREDVASFPKPSRRRRRVT